MINVRFIQICVSSKKFRRWIASKFCLHFAIYSFLFRLNCEFIRHKVTENLFKRPYVHCTIFVSVTIYSIPLLFVSWIKWQNQRHTDTVYTSLETFTFFSRGNNYISFDRIHSSFCVVFFNCDVHILCTLFTEDKCRIELNWMRNENVCASVDRIRMKSKNCLVKWQRFSLSFFEVDFWQCANASKCFLHEKNNILMHMT